MKDNIIELIQNDEKVNKLLNEFRIEFTEVYKSLGEKEKEITIKNGDEIFRRWLYSPLVLETYINPNYVINNIAQKYCSGDYVIVPHISIFKNEGNDVLFKTDYLYYSIDEHPILNDIYRMIEKCNPVLTLKNTEEFDDYEYELLEGLSFNSMYYSLYLVELLERLNIITRMQSIGCRCYQVSEKYKTFIKLSNENKLKEILKETIDMVTNSINNINFIEGLIDRGNIIKYLNNGITDDVYTSILQEVDPLDKKFLNDIYRFSQGIDTNHMISVEIINSLGYEEIADYVISRELKRELDRAFTTVFSYYLGIIKPNYDRPFLHYEIIKGICEAKDILEKELFIFDCDNIHDLTSLGVKLISNYHNEINQEYIKDMNLNHIDAAIQTSRKQRKELLKEFKKKKKQLLLNLK